MCCKLSLMPLSLTRNSFGFGSFNITAMDMKDTVIVNALTNRSFSFADEHISLLLTSTYLILYSYKNSPVTLI